MTICLAVAKSVSLTKCHFLSLLFRAPAERSSEFCGVETFDALAGPSCVSRSAQMQPLSVPRQITKQYSVC